MAHTLVDPLNSILIQNPDTVPEPQPQVAGQDLYFEVLELQPIRLTLSFMRTERVSSDNRSVFAKIPFRVYQC